MLSELPWKWAAVAISRATLVKREKRSKCYYHLDHTHWQLAQRQDRQLSGFGFWKEVPFAGRRVKVKETRVGTVVAFQYKATAKAGYLWRGYLDHHLAFRLFKTCRLVILG